ncbi:hypothetical protein SVIO_109570 [Streptomyces violaceusniger]|uniref:Uncharacterized protein n=1 Tax=Streptomyces violaceusniger TaxID=68280 RepID=A0A4D4LIP5_STRVO|nr:hypothetical protein SVIO_109570 [Streptomyces violaceusniger]
MRSGEFISQSVSIAGDAFPWAKCSKRRYDNSTSRREYADAAAECTGTPNRDPSVVSTRAVISMGLCGPRTTSKTLANDRPVVVLAGMSSTVTVVTCCQGQESSRGPIAVRRSGARLTAEGIVPGGAPR